jgi:EF hand
MKTYHLQCLLAIAASLTASARPPRPQPRDHPPQIPPIFAVFDADHDMVLSTEEVAAASTALAGLDKDGDGKITLREAFMPPSERENRQKRRNDKKQEKPEPMPEPEKRPAPPLIEALDTDADGTISAEELKNAPESLKQLDKDGDGALSPEEMHPKGHPPQGPEDPMEEE